MLPKEKDAFRARVQNKIAIRNGTASIADLNEAMFNWRERMARIFNVKPIHPQSNYVRDINAFSKYPKE
jgi:hypothetical protein